MTHPTRPALQATPSRRAMGVRRFGLINWLGLWTLAAREVMRFLSVWAQTLAAPLITAGLFLAVFALALGEGRAPAEAVRFANAAAAMKCSRGAGPEGLPRRQETEALLQGGALHQDQERTQG